MIPEIVPEALPQLEARGLSRAYAGRSVVRKVDLTVRGGEIVGLLGPNGAGKTTTFQMMIGLIPPTEGHISLDGEEITRMPMYLRARRGISYLPQESSVFRKLTVEENILAILETRPLEDGDRRARLQSLLAEMRLTHLAGNKAYTLSGGERRRLEIARALVISPRFMLLDEPFSGIDPIIVMELQNILFQLKERGIGLLMTDHNVQKTLEVVDRAYLIYNGEILIEGTPEEISDNQEARAVYLGDHPFVPNGGRRRDDVPAQPSGPMDNPGRKVPHGFV
jgi:lipopolysaccharide export system ATP-binding protein